MTTDLSSLLTGRHYDPVQIVREVRSGWKVGIIPTFTLGINDAVPADLIEDGQCPYIRNLSFFSGVCKVDTGYKVFATALEHMPRGVFEHKKADGSPTILCVTNRSVYKYNSTYEAWQVIKGTVATTLSVALVGGQTQITVASTTGMVTGAIIGITLDSGAQLVREIATLPGAAVVTFVTAAPGSGTIAAIGKAVIQGVKLAGSDNEQVVFAAVPGNEWTVFTNGVDPMYRYDSTADTVVTVASLSGGTLGADVICKTLAMYRDTLVIANLIETAVYRPYKVWWADPGDPTEWTGGNSGDNSLLDSRDSIIAMKPIGASMAIYRSNSIVLMDYQGQVNAFFRFQVAVYGESVGSQGVGAVSPNAVFALPNEAVVMSKDGIYLYRGGYNIQIISSPIFNGTFSAQGDMNSDAVALGRAFCHFADRTNEVFFFYLSSGNPSWTFPDKALVLSLDTGGFRKRSFFRQISAAASKTSAPTFTAIDDLVGTIDEQDWLLGGAAVIGGIDTILLCSEDSYRVMEYDYITPTDNGRDLSWQLETKDFDGVDKDIIIDWVEFELGAVYAVVRVSTDRGQTWSTIGAHQSNTDLQPRRFHVNKTAGRFRFQVDGLGGGGKIGKLAFKYKEAYPAA